MSSQSMSPQSSFGRAPLRRSAEATGPKREAGFDRYAVYGALLFIALIVVSTLPHRLF